MSIFIDSGEGLTVLSEAPYEDEGVLQKLLADYPELLAGGRTGETGASGLLLIKREMGIPSTAGGGATFSVDHLFVDPDGVPVIVEVKRSSDTRIRREVVGQMLDYAANGRRYWPPGELRATFTDTAGGAEEAQRQLETLTPEEDPDAFWAKVDTNLRDGRVRLVFVADSIPAELAAIIEFLNEQMNPAEVLGVEVLRYRSETTGEVAFVPHLIGDTTTAAATKQVAARPWDRETFLSEAAVRCPGQVDKFRRLFDHVVSRKGRFSWGRGASPGVSGWYPLDGGGTRALWTANTSTGSGAARPYIYLYVNDAHARLSQERFDAFITALEAIPAFTSKIQEARQTNWTSKYPSVYLTDLDDSSFSAFLEAIDLTVEDLITSHVG